MAQPTEYVYSGAFIPGSLARAEQVGIEFTSVQQGFAALAIQGVDTGTANTYVVATSGGKDGVYSDGLCLEFKALNGNTGGCTITVDAGAVVALTGPGGTPLGAGAVQAGTWYICRYNSTYSCFTLLSPIVLSTTSNTISSAPPTHLVGLIPAGGVSTACAPIDVTFALDQTISPTMTGTWVFSGAVSFNSTVSFASGFTLTGASGAYAITLDGSAVTGNSYGVKIAAGTNGADIAFLITSQSGTTFFTVAGTGGITVGTPTGGSQGIGTINATGLFVNGAAVKTTSISSANPTAVIGLSAVNGTAATFMTSDSAPALSQAIAPTMTGKWIFTPSSAVTAVTINAAINAVGLAIVGGTNTVNTYLVTLATGSGVGFSSGVSLSAGTAATDVALLVQNAAATSIFLELFGDGHGTLGYNGTSAVMTWATGTSADTTLYFTTAGAASGYLQFYDSTNSAFRGYVGSGSNLFTGGAIGDFGIAAQSGKVRLSTNAGAATQFIVNGEVAPTIEGWGPTAGALVDLTPDQGTFTITYTGMTGSVTGTAVWARIGSLVMLYLPAATGTSNAATFTATGLPTAIQPARTQVAAAFSGGTTAGLGCFENNNAVTSASVTMNAGSGTITFGLIGPGGSGGWSNGNTKGVATAFTAAYLLN
jgi:hypothetical protein